MTELFDTVHTVLPTVDSRASLSVHGSSGHGSASSYLDIRTLMTVHPLASPLGRTIHSVPAFSLRLTPSVPRTLPRRCYLHSSAHDLFCPGAVQRRAASRASLIGRSWALFLLLLVSKPGYIVAWSDFFRPCIASQCRPRCSVNGRGVSGLTSSLPAGDRALYAVAKLSLLKGRSRSSRYALTVSSAPARRSSSR